MESLKKKSAIELVDYLKMITEFSIPNDHLKYRCMEHFVLENGQIFETGHAIKKSHLGRPKECFRNAGSRFVDDQLFEKKEYSYVEGYAIGCIIPVLHAWLVDSDGHVIETTWKTLGDSYYGVKIPFHYFRSVVAERGSWGVVDNMEMRYPLLTGEHNWRGIIAE